jgi:transforming growth factor-beta-induced protein
MKTFTTTALLGAFALVSPVIAGQCNSKHGNDIIQTAVAAGSFKTLAAALKAADLIGPLQGKGPFTVFAPTDAAFAKLPKGTVEELLKPENKQKLQAVLKFHVIQGKVGLSDALAAKSAETLQGSPIHIGFENGNVMVNNATLSSADVAASNGVIHVIDTVLLPPAPKNDIANVAKRAGQFNTLLAAVKAAGLQGALSGDKPLTVLAPTDAAFKALPKGTVESLLKHENREQLKNILSLHVLSGKISAGDALNAGTAKALNGEKLDFGIETGKFTVNGATIVRTDIACDNGVIHVIDAVLLPSEKTTAKSSCRPQQKSAEMPPSLMIQAAIKEGVPVFNSGDHGKCADIYQNCLVSLAEDPRVSRSMRNTLTKTLDHAEEVSCQTTQAWVLRKALDHAHAQMN